MMNKAAAFAALPILIFILSSIYHIDQNSQTKSVNEPTWSMQGVRFFPATGGKKRTKQSPVRFRSAMLFKARRASCCAACGLPFGSTFLSARVCII
jgi:hypothetical protein